MPNTQVSREARQTFKAAIQCIKNRDSNAARAALLKLENGSGMSQFHRLMARTALLDKDLPLAESHLQQAIALEPTRPILRAEASLLAFRNNNHERASELARSIDISQADSSGDLLRCANALQMVEAYEEAAKFLEKALRLSPQNVKVRHRYALVLVSLHRLAEARDQWTYCLSYDPGSADAKLGLARLAMAEKDFPAAINLLKASVEDPSAAPGSTLRLTLAEACFRSGNIDQARRLLSQLEDMDGNPRFHYLWGLVHQATGTHPLALASIRRCIELGQQQSAAARSQLTPLPETYPGDDEAARLTAEAIQRLEPFFGPLQSLRSFQQPAMDEDDAQEIV